MISKISNSSIEKGGLVTFVIPCYKLAHYLSECIESIICQSYKNIEIIILDDRSPDNTSEVASAIIANHSDRRITYVLNTENIGNINNYNKGIKLSSGSYIWILSPDDRLSNRTIVDKYVNLMEFNPNIGYIFCSANLIMDDVNTGLYLPSLYKMKDQILDSRQLIKDIADDDVFELIAASVMIRKECYEKITFFPPDMPHRGDSYVWALIAMRYDVGYFAAPMVDYRIHDNSMASTFAREDFSSIIKDNIAVPWRIKEAAQNLNNIDLVNHCLYSIIKIYKGCLLGETIRGYKYRITIEDFEDSLLRWESNPDNRIKVRMILVNSLYWTGIAYLIVGQISRARTAFNYSVYIQPSLLYHPPLLQFIKTPIYRQFLQVFFKKFKIISRYLAKRTVFKN